jgi:uncharacterized protein YdiU (UPF0061 family)
MQPSILTSLDQFRLDTTFIERLPADPETENFRRQVKNTCFSWVTPRPATDPSLLAWSREMLEVLDLSPCVVSDPAFSRVFCGNQLPPGMQPYSMCYGGHQFGSWAGQLGDGRAIILGDVVTTAGDLWSLQLKGGGPTPYSRRADGFAVLRSSVREFLCSEAMHHLGIPTTRALSLCLTGEEVVRDMFYDGHPTAEPGAVVCRVAPTFLRFGNFQIHAAQRNVETLKQLADYCIQQFFPHLRVPSVDTYIQWFDEICSSTADMIVHWQRVGFVHGVMNTDNMSILGLTIDYGPYGWLEQALNRYRDRYDQGWAKTTASKLGFAESSAEIEGLYRELENLLRPVETDMTLFFRGLASLDLDSTDCSEFSRLRSVFAECWYRDDQLTSEYLQSLSDWVLRYQQLVRSQGLDEGRRVNTMNAVNPRYVLRNYLAQLAIDKAEQGDTSVLEELMEVLRKPYDEQPGYEKYAQKRPEWARHRAGCCMLSCSS